jgi:hypothetical protein
MAPWQSEQKPYVSHMTASEKEAIRAYVSRWENATPLLQQVRDADIRAADTAQSMRIFSGSATWAVTHRPAGPTSGLVEQQRWFMKLRHGR